MTTNLPLSTPPIPEPFDPAFRANYADSLINGIEAGQIASERVQGQMTFTPEDGQKEYFQIHQRFAFDIERVAFFCEPAGSTATLEIEINTTPVGGLGALSATDTKQVVDATSANSVAITDMVGVTPTAIVGVERIHVSIWGKMTALPQEVV